MTEVQKLNNPSGATTKSRTALCQCGTLRLTVAGAPVHHHACTCTRCQRRSGSALTVTAWYPRDQMLAIRGETHMWRTGGEGTETYRCAICGGGGYFLSGEYLPHCIAIRAGYFADPDYPSPQHIHWWPKRPRWLKAPVGADLLNGN
jgi:hypothetical protein